jgi:hypothetical protein
MVHNRICEKRAEALATQRRTQYLRANAARARQNTSRTDKVRDLRMASISDRTVLVERRPALKKALACLRYRDDARLRQSQSDGEAPRAEENSFRDRELQWLAAHRHEYPGLWVALDGYTLVASSQSLAEVLRQARHKGSPNPLVAWSGEIAEAPFGGW